MPIELHRPRALATMKVPEVDGFWIFVIALIVLLIAVVGIRRPSDAEIEARMTDIASP